ncbi:MAG TPA: methyltransferase [Beijerinckiaceae bacterium]|nr:methyltransferase [Beijerinckiaceae bacterium]
MHRSRRTKLVLAALLASILASASFAQTPKNVDQALKAAIDGPQRTPAFKLRDKYRHPLQTLEFFGVRPDMTVIEVLPGAGWFTEILAPFLKHDGALVEAAPPAKGPMQMGSSFQKKLTSNPQVYGKIRLTPFEPPDYMALGAPSSADMVLTFLNMHDLVYFNVHHQVTDAIMQRFFRAAYQALKPGGVLGVVAHRAKAGEGIGASIKKARVPQDYVVNEARRAGFKLSAASQINANPKDDGSLPIWYLPPTLALGQKDRAKYLAIGESDDMTLRFVKPKE